MHALKLKCPQSVLSTLLVIALFEIYIGYRTKADKGGVTKADLVEVVLKPTVFSYPVITPSVTRPKADAENKMARPLPGSMAWQ